MQHPASVRGALPANQSDAGSLPADPEWSADPLPSPALAAFVAAVHHGSIQRAADALHLGQSATTKRIQGLERRVGARLLERGRHGVAPTAAGRLLAARAAPVLSALHRAEADLAAAVGRAPLQLWASHTAGDVLLPIWLGRYRRTGAAPAISVMVTNSRDVLARMQADPAGVGFIEGVPVPVGFESLVVARDAVRVVVRAGHPWSARAAIGPRDLLREPYYAREPGSGIRAFAAERLAAAGIELQPALELSSSVGLRHAVRLGGYTLQSDLAVAGDPTLAAIPLRGLDMTRAITALRTREAGAPALAFWRWLRRGPAARQISA